MLLQSYIFCTCKMFRQILQQNYSNSCKHMQMKQLQKVKKKTNRSCLVYSLPSIQFLGQLREEEKILGFGLLTHVVQSTISLSAILKEPPRHAFPKHVEAACTATWLAAIHIANDTNSFIFTAEFNTYRASRSRRDEQLEFERECWCIRAKLPYCIVVVRGGYVYVYMWMCCE